MSDLEHALADPAAPDVAGDRARRRWAVEQVLADPKRTRTDLAYIVNASLVLEMFEMAGAACAINAAITVDSHSGNIVEPRYVPVQVPERSADL